MVANAVRRTGTFPVMSDESYDLWIDTEAVLAANSVEKVKMYIGRAMNDQKTGRKTSPEVLEVFRKRLLDSAHDKMSGKQLEKYCQKFDELWQSTMKKWLTDHPVTVEYMMDMGGCESPGFYNAVVAIALAPDHTSALTLEVTYNHVMDIIGHTWENDASDALTLLCAYNALMVEMRWRDYYILQHIKKSNRIASVGAGLYRELRSHGGLDLSELQKKEFVGVDRDASLIPWLDPAFQFYYGVHDFAETGIQHNSGDFSKLWDNDEYKEHFDFVYSAGTYSYQTKMVDGQWVPDDEAAFRLLKNNFEMVVPGGIMLTTAEILKMDMGLNVSVFGWQGNPKMVPDKDPSHSIERFTSFAAQLDGVDRFDVMIEPRRQSGAIYILRKAA